LSSINYITPKHIKILVYILDNGGEVIGFRDMAMRFKIGYGSLSSALKELQFLNLITKDHGPNNVSIYRLTPKGRRAAEILKQLIEILEGE